MISSFYKHDFLHSQNTLSSELRNIEKHSRTISETIYTYIYIYTHIRIKYLRSNLLFLLLLFIFLKKIFSMYIYPIKINIPLHLHKKMSMVNINRLLKEYPSTLLEEISVFAKMPFLCKLPLVRGKSDG